MNRLINVKDLLQVFDQNPIPLVMLSPDEIILHVNKIFLKYFQYSRDEIIGKNINDFIVPGDKQNEIVEFYNIVSNKKPLSFKTKRKRKDGKILDVRIIGYPIVEKKVVKGVIAAYYDITKDIKLEEELNLKTKTLESIFTLSPVGMILVNDNNKIILDANEKAYQLLECRRNNLIGQKIDDTNLNCLFKNKYQNFQELINIEQEVQTYKDNIVILLFNSTKMSVGNNKYCIQTFMDITELKMNSKKLNLLDTALKNSIDGVMMHDSDFNIIFINEAWAKIHGFKLNQLENKNVKTCLPKHMVENEEINKFRAALQKEGKKIDIVKSVKRDGTEFVTAISGSLINDEKGDLAASLFINRDITSEVESQKKLFDSEQKFRALTESDLTGIITLNTEGNITYVNSTFANMILSSPEEIIGTKYTDLLPNEAIEFAKMAIHKIQTGETIATEVKLERKDGKIITVSTHSSPLYDINNKIEGNIAMVYDITEKIIAEQELHENEMKFRTITSSAKEAIVMINDIGKVTYWNQAATDIFGYNESEILGENLHELLASKENYELFKQKFPHFRQTGRGDAVNNTREIEAIHKYGKKIPIELSLSSVKLNLKWYAVGIMRDITDRKKYEEQIKASRDEALEISKLKSQFLANMSHEIRTPMNGIIGMIDVLLGTKLNTEQSDYANMIKTSAESLLSLLNDFLDYSKIESGKMELENIVFSLEEEIRNALEPMAFRAQEKNLELIYHIPIDIPNRLSGDPKRLMQIIVNLVSNAIKFTSDGEITLRVSTFAKKKKYLDLLFVVSDTGIGIPKNKIKNIFEAFSQADGSTTRMYGGTGLGLSISSQFVKMMGGDIWVESEEGKGSTFFFTCRFENIPPRQKGLFYQSQKECFSYKKVLIVDDNDTGRLILNEMFKSFGFKTYTSPGARDALETIESTKTKNEKIDLILIDSVMPEIDGFKLLQSIRENYKDEFKIMMMLSSRGRKDEIEKCEKMKIDTYVIKPVSQSSLLDVLYQIFEITLSKQPLYRDYDENEDLYQGEPLKILLVEDNIINQKLATIMLENKGHTVTLAKDGAEAITFFKQNSFDVILMDIQMPIMDGFEATARIRSYEKIRNLKPVPIVAMTAHAMKGDEERCLNAGMDDYISKPINFDLLSDIIQSITDHPVRPAINNLTESSDDVLNYYKLLKQFGNNNELLMEIIDTFLADSTEQLNKIKQSIDNEDIEQVQFNAHSLKGSVGVFTKGTIYHILLEIENFAKQNDKKNIRKAYNQFYKSFSSFKRELKKLQQVHKT